MKLYSKYWLVIFFICGVLFKLWFVGLAPQPFAFDQEEYHRVALDLLGNRDYQYTTSYRLWGYPMLLATVYSIFGTQDNFWWMVVQAGIDSLTAVMIFLLARKLFHEPLGNADKLRDSSPAARGRNDKSNRIAWISFLLYLFNPYTSAYVGVRLTEITAIFLVTAIFYLLLKFRILKSWVYFILLAISSGYLPFVRPGYLYFSLFVSVFSIREIIISTKIWKYKIIGISTFTLIFLSFFIFNIVRNYKYFNQAALLTVDNLFVREFYISLYIDSYDNNSDIPKPVDNIYREYSTTKTKVERQNMAQKYLNLAIIEVAQNPIQFITRRLMKLWLVWEKHDLFTYENPRNVFSGKLVFWSNNALLIVSGMGAVLAAKKIKERWFIKLSFFLIVYISVLHAFTITAERFSLPAYPLLFLFAGYGIWNIIRKVIKQLS